MVCEYDYLIEIVMTDHKIQLCLERITPFVRHKNLYLFISLILVDYINTCKWFLQNTKA